MSTVREEIHSKIQEITALRRVESHLNALQKQIAEQTNAISDLERTVESELRDVERLEGISIKGLFYKILGSEEDQIEKERQDYLRAALAYKDALETLEMIEYERTVIVEKVSTIDRLELALADLKSRRELEIRSANGAVADQLRHIDHLTDQQHAVLQEVNEALTAGHLALQSVEAVLTHLANAIKWGKWDMAKRGQGYYDHQKNSAIDRAVREATRSRQHIHRFSDELVDLGISGEGLQLDVQIERSFMSMFFDNMISDWIVQQKISTTKDTVQEAYFKIKVVLDALEDERVATKLDIQDLFDQRDDILIA